MKKHITVLVLLGAIASAHAAQPSKRDTEEMKSAAEFAVKKEWIKAGEPKTIGKDLYQVPVSVANKICKATVGPDESTIAPWRWKVIAMNCPAK